MSVKMEPVIINIKSLYDELDKLMEAFDLIEERLRGITVKQDNLRLTIERFNGKMRLCWDGKPITECTTEDKLQAVEHIELLIKVRNDIIVNLTNRAAKSINYINNLFDF